MATGELRPLTHEAFRRRQRTVDLDGLSDEPLRVAWTDVGEGDPVILLHGIPTWSFLYNEVIPLLASHRRVIAPDFLGHGYSDKRDFFDRSLLAQTEMIIRLMNYLGLDRADFVGHDTGGGVALIMAIRHPERVARLVLTNVVAYDSWPIDDMIALGNPNWRSKSPSEVAKFIASGLPDGILNKTKLTPEFEAGIVAPYSDEEGKISIIRNASSLNTNHTTMLVAKHGDISAPTLCLWGIHDPWQTIADGERLAREIPNARLVRVENASHWIPQDTPEVFAEEVGIFLRRE
jgi:haloalkane dehalogenase